MENLNKTTNMDNKNQTTRPKKCSESSEQISTSNTFSTYSISRTGTIPKTETYANVISTRETNNHELSSLEQLRAMEESAGLIPCNEYFICPLCETVFKPNVGVALRDCLHYFCIKCLSRVVQESEEAEVRCPRKECEGIIQQKEIKCLLPGDLYEKFLEDSFNKIKLLDVEIKNRSNVKYDGARGGTQINQDPEQTVLSPVEDLMALQDSDGLIPCKEHFECPICLEDFKPNEGVILRECGHSSCPDCLLRAIQATEEAQVRCPRKECKGFIQQKEIKCFLPGDLYEKFLQDSFLKINLQNSDTFNFTKSDRTNWSDAEKNLDQINCRFCGKVNYIGCLNQDPKQTVISPVEDLMALQESDGLIPCKEHFQCPICLEDFKPNQGVILRECGHSSCPDCLSRAIQATEEAQVRCPQTGCEGFLQQKEIKCLVPQELFEKFLRDSFNKIEQQTKGSVHCKEPNCTGWFVIEEKVDQFKCCVCGKVNCIKCDTTHSPLSCSEFKNRRKVRDDDAITAAQVQQMIWNRGIMRCPDCKVCLEN